MRFHRLPALWMVLVGLAASAGLGVPGQDTGKNEDVALFNGKDLTGWERYSNEPKADLDALFRVDPAEKSIVIQGKPMGYLLTEKEYDNYALTLEWRWGVGENTPRSPAEFRGNSGVLLHVSGANKLWPKSVEAQLESNHAGDFWLIDGFRLSVDAKRQDPRSTRHFLRMKENVEKRVGEWNRYEITCRKDTVRLKVNGVEMNEGSGAEPSRGKIAIQSEGAEIHLRNLTLKHLK
jgi:hypothetical protein